MANLVDVTYRDMSGQPLRPQVVIAVVASLLLVNVVSAEPRALPRPQLPRVEPKPLPKPQPAPRAEPPWRLSGPRRWQHS